MHEKSTTGNKVTSCDFGKDNAAFVVLSFFSIFAYKISALKIDIFKLFFNPDL